jgi:hypothetical protein
MTSFSNGSFFPFENHEFRRTRTDMPYSITSSARAMPAA